MDSALDWLADCYPNGVGNADETGLSRSLKQAMTLATAFSPNAVYLRE
jgi:hypothetical protein